MLRAVALLLSLPFVIVIYIFFSESLAIATLVYISTAGIKVRSIEMAARSMLPRFYPGAEHRDVNLKVLKVPELEQKVLDATSDEPWGPLKCSFRVSASHKEIGAFNPEYFHVQGASRRRGAARRLAAIQRGMCPQKMGIINWDAEDLRFLGRSAGTWCLLLMIQCSPAFSMLHLNATLEDKNPVRCNTL